MSVGLTTSAAATRLIVVRHGQTEWNAAGRIQGHLNSRLDADGRAQAEALAARLVGEPLAAIYTSDLGRTLETAAPTASGRMMDITTDPRLRERHLGVFQGLTFAEASREFPAMFALYKARDLHVNFEHGESLVMLRERVAEVLTEIANRHAGEAVLIAPMIAGQEVRATFAFDGHTREFSATMDGDLPVVAFSKPGPNQPNIPGPGDTAAYCACAKDCTKATAPADADCTRTYANDCPKMLACAAGAPDAAPVCAEGHGHFGVTRRCKPLCSKEVPCAAGTCTPWQGGNVCL